MIDLLNTLILTAALATAITCTGIGAGLFCVLVARDLVRRVRE